jgi:hypothetical protein
MIDRQTSKAAQPVFVLHKRKSSLTLAARLTEKTAVLKVDVIPDRDRQLKCAILFSRVHFILARGRAKWLIPFAPGFAPGCPTARRAICVNFV